jgi:hypothetical protein
MSYDENDAAPQTAERKSGRAAFDDNGHTVWEWQTTTGVFERYVSDEQLHELTSPHLAIAEDFAPASRKCEGLWVHDAHRSAIASRPRKVESKSRRAEPESAASSMSSVMSFLRRLSGR